MPDPINPRLGDDALVEDIMRSYPTLSLDKLLEMAAAFGFDLNPSPELRRKWQRERPAGPQ